MPARLNYGLIFMARADYANARICFERAAALAPNYDALEINRGILEGATGNPTDAAEHFRRALSLNPSSAMARYYYGRWSTRTGATARRPSSSSLRLPRARPILKRGTC